MASNAEQGHARRWLGLVLAGLMGVGGLAIVGEGSAAESVRPGKDADLRPRVKALIAEALKVGDLWTAIQADAYASQKLGVRSSGVLGSSEVIGDPLFAYPHTIAGHHQHGDQVLVVAGQRLYRQAADGRPLSVSLPLGLHANASGMSVNGNFLAAVERQRNPAWALKVVVINLTSGAEVFTATQSLVRGDLVNGDVQVSDDGSAVAVGVLNDDDNDVPRVAVLRASGKHVVLKNYFRPVGIGVDGAWGIAEPASNRTSDERHWALLQGGSALPCRSVAVGPGMAAAIGVEDATTVQLVARDGTHASLVLPHELGTSPRVLSTGDWLLVASGWPQTKAEEVDLLGNPVGPGEPYVTWFYRWSDLATTGVKSVPALTVAGVPGISTLVSSTVFVGAENAVQVVDLAQAKPEAKSLMTAAGKVRAIEPQHGRVLLKLREGKYQIIDESGADLWNGEASDSVVLHDPWYASIHQDDGTVDWVRLSATTGERSVQRLQLPATDYDLALDRYHRRLIASRSRTEWVEFDPLTGKTQKLLGLRPGRPQVIRPEPGGVISTFSVQVARLVPRLELPALDEPLLRWNPLDAWRANGTLVVLDHHGQVHVPSRKRGIYQVLGSVDFPGQFAQTTAGDLLVVSEENLGRARLAAGPLLATEGQGIGQKAEPLPEGPWRVKNLFFIPPRAGSLMWDATRCGFSPTRLRSPPPPATGMLVVTDSLVFDLDQAVGKQLGVLDKGGLRDAEE